MLEEGTAQGTQHRAFSSAVTLMWAGDGGGRQGVQCWSALGTLHVLWGHCTCHGALRHCLGTLHTVQGPCMIPGTLHTAQDTAPCLGTPNAAGDLPGDPAHTLGTLHNAWGHCLGTLLGNLDTPWGPCTLPKGPCVKSGPSTLPGDTGHCQGHSLRTLHTPGTRQAAWALHIPGASELTGDTADCLGTPNTPGQGILHVSPKMCMPSPLSRCTELLVPSLHSSCSPALIPGLPQRNGVKLVCPMALSPFRAAVPWLK